MNTIVGHGRDWRLIIVAVWNGWLGPQSPEVTRRARQAFTHYVPGLRSACQVRSSPGTVESFMSEYDCGEGVRGSGSEDILQSIAKKFHLQRYGKDLIIAAHGST